MRICSFDVDGLRSWTDVFTNQTFISSIKTGFNPRDIIEGNLPEPCLADFLHETTHHWCLSSPVGIALAVLEQRIRSLMREASPELHPELVENYLRLDCALKFLRPALEGLALFAEFDATPSSARRVSSPMQTTIRYFLGRRIREKPDVDIYFELFGLLDRSRGSARFVERKVEVLCSPVRAQEGYLSGYAFMKNFATRSRMVSTTASDSDLLMAFLCSYFFYDYKLVYLLLRKAMHESEEIMVLVEYMEQRIKALWYIDDLDDVLDNFDAEPEKELDLIADPWGITSDRPGYGVDGEEAKEGKILLQMSLSNDGDVRTLGRLREIARRNLLNIISYPVHIEFSGQSFAAKDKNGYLVFGKLDEPWCGATGVEGTVDYLYDTAFFGSLFTVSVGPKIIAMIMEGPFAKLSKREKSLYEKQIREYVTSFKVLRESSNENEKRVQNYFDKHGVYESAKRISDKAGEVMNNAYGALGFGWVPKRNLKRVINILNKGGFLSVLDKNLVRSLAVVGQLDNRGAYLEEVGFIGSSRNLTRDIEKIVRTLSRRFGGSPILRRKTGTGTEIISFI